MWVPGRRLRLLGAATLALLAILVAALVAYSSVALARFGRVEARRSTLMYAAPQPLVAGVHVRRVDLAGTLARLKYTETREAPNAPGQYRRAGGAWEIHLRGTEGAGAQLVRLDIRDERIARVTRSGNDIGAASLEPEVLASADDRPGEEHRPVRLADVPPVVRNAILAAEDHRFFEHGGLDPRGLVRAAWTNLRAGRVMQGGSTITQQLIKNRLLGARRTFWRKLNEAWLATLVEWRYSKEQILEAYLNEIYLGQRGGLAVRGVGAAARVYFRKEIHQLTPAEAALLAGMVRAPNSYSPVVDPERARTRRDVVLGRMRELGMLSETDWKAARAEPVRVPPATTVAQAAPYFTDYVRLELEQRWGDVTENVGARVYTSLDPVLQRFAEAAVIRGLDRLETQWPRLGRAEPTRRLQAALVALDPATGEIRALVGGRDYQVSQYNRARPGPPTARLGVQAVRVSGRAATARRPACAHRGLDRGRRADHAHGRQQRLDSAKLRRPLRGPGDRAARAGALAQRRDGPGGREGRPAGGDRDGAQPRSARVRSPRCRRSCWAHSRRHRSSSRARIFRSPTAACGRPTCSRCTPSTIATAPSIPGTPPRPRRGAHARRGLPHDLAAGGRDSVGHRHGGARALGVTGAVAGKTGTTNDGRDAWFVGYTPRLLTVVWIGFDGGDAHGLSGAEAALPVWADFMRQAIETAPPAAFDVPSGITFAQIDVTNGLIANRFCPVVARETFLVGTEPAACGEHGGLTDQITDWWNRLRGWFSR